jgi:hypothetical protein
MDNYRVALEPDERAALEQLVSKGKSASRKLAHARVLLLADTASGGESTDEDIVTAVGVSPRTIARVRKQFVTEGVESASDHRPQPARPDKIKGDVDQKLVELACTDPPRGRCRWTLKLLADEMVVLGLVDSISTETVRQALKKNDIQPWIVQSWCIPSEANAEFVWRMEDVIQTYMLPYDPKWPVV